VHEGGSKGFVESLTLLSQRLNARGGEIKGKNCAVFCFAGKRKIFFIYLSSDYLGKKKKKLC
jgi:hypothetical protein